MLLHSTETREMEKRESKSERERKREREKRERTNNKLESTMQYKKLFILSLPCAPAHGVVKIGHVVGKLRNLLEERDRDSKRERERERQREIASERSP